MSKKKELEKESSDKHKMLCNIREKSVYAIWEEDLDALEKKLLNWADPFEPKDQTDQYDNEDPHTDCNVNHPSIYNMTFNRLDQFFSSFKGTTI